jgi:hypothetical protein
MYATNIIENEEDRAENNAMEGFAPVKTTVNPFSTIDDQFRKLDVQKQPEPPTAAKKEFMHGALIRNDVNVPDINAPICTKKFLLEVK